MRRRTKAEREVTPVDLDAVQHSGPRPQSDFDLWCEQQDTSWEHVATGLERDWKGVGD